MSPNSYKALIWYFNLKDEVSGGEEPYIGTNDFYLENGVADVEADKITPNRTPTLSELRAILQCRCHPPLSQEQMEAAGILKETCNRLRLLTVPLIGETQC